MDRFRGGSGAPTVVWGLRGLKCSGVASLRRAKADEMEWDAGDLGCGELVIFLRRRMEAVPPGGTLRVIARDKGAPEDLPSWCRLTRHELVHAAHPMYVIRRRKED